MRILHLAEVESTNRYALERFETLEDGTVVVADRQTSGRGRLDRSWQSSVVGNLYASLALKVEASAPPRGLPNLTQYLTLVLARVVERSGAQPGIKWPNDLQIAGRKVAGVLAEAVNNLGGIVGVVLGAGVNLAMSAADLDAIDQPATSLNIVLGRPVDRDWFLGEMLREFSAGYPAFMETGFESIRDEFLSRTPFLGRPISVNSGYSWTSGVACDITERGSLVVLTPRGRVELTVGDVE